MLPEIWMTQRLIAESFLKTRMSKRERLVRGGMVKVRRNDHSGDEMDLI